MKCSTRRMLETRRQNKLLEQDAVMFINRIIWAIGLATILAALTGIHGPVD